MPVAFLARALDWGVRRDRVGARVRFGAVGGEADPRLPLTGADHGVGDAVAGIRAEVGTQVDARADGRDVAARVGVHRGAGDVLVERVAGGKDRARVLARRRTGVPL